MLEENYIILASLLVIWVVVGFGWMLFAMSKMARDRRYSEARIFGVAMLNWVVWPLAMVAYAIARYRKKNTLFGC